VAAKQQGMMSSSRVLSCLVVCCCIPATSDTRNLFNWRDLVL
jgi:hypothetical protein